MLSLVRLACRKAEVMSVAAVVQLLISDRVSRIRSDMLCGVAA